MRYSRKFRLFMGVLAFISGILNTASSPASARGSDLFSRSSAQRAWRLNLSLIMLAYLSCTVFLVLVAGRRR